ncbi:MAG: class I SAM-dependent methyltransferase [Acidobacteria bacterium]|nr:MAG: class I SAM-dependent methyltransferase [Acidobacteriota bacterium]REK06372.1 MAG: class I SAM-dependent methyltransferase [Acidobacteriota bacterium]
MSEDTGPIPHDDEALRKFAFTVWSYKQGELVSLMVHLGDRLGIYKAMRGAGPVTAAELAEKTGLQERWLLEWLKGQAAARLIEYRGNPLEKEGEPPFEHDDEAAAARFELTALQAAVLADERDSVMFAAGAFGGPLPPDVVEGIAEAFRTGIGLSYDQLGRSAAHRTERMLGPWSRLALVPRIIPALEGVQQRLEAGADVADVGCGGGVALLTMAQAFPNSRFTGYDPSANAIALAEERLAERGLDNVRFVQARGEELPAEPTYDFLITFDCLHDMTRPDRVMRAIHDALRPDGVWLIKDIRSKGSFEADLKNPMLPLLYGFSVSSCMSSALSEPGGMGLGTLGLPPQRAEEMAREVGFGSFRVHDFDDPSNLYYEVRR